MIDQFLLAFAVCVLLLYFSMKKSNNRLPPGPIRLPLLGSVIQLYRANPQCPHLALTKLARKYGEIMSFALGMETAVLFSSYESMKEIFKRIDTNLYRFEFPYVFDRNYGKNLGIVFASGQNWIDIKKFTKKILKEFGYGKPKTMDPSLIDSANQLVDGIKIDLLDSLDGTYSVKSEKFAIHVINVLWNLVGGYKFNPYDDLIKRNMECCNIFLQIIGFQNPYNLFPFLKTWFPNQVRYPEHLKIHKDIHESTKTLIKDAKERRSQRLDSEPTSFIETFLDKIEGNHGNADTLYTQEQLEIILEDLFLGGSETTGTVLNWSLLFLVKNPDIQEKCRKEILNKMGSIELLQSVELKRLPFFKTTILEIFRMGNVGPIPPPRRSTQDFTFKDYIIPKDTILFYNLHSIYSDQHYWKDPENFRPERFLNECGEVDQLRSERILNTVFGFGPRVCFGESIALDSLFIFLAAMIINFRFDCIPGQEPSADNPNFKMSVSPQAYSIKIATI